MLEAAKKQLETQVCSDYQQEKEHGPWVQESWDDQEAKHNSS